ncbi:dynamin family protein [Rhodococcus sp. BP-252]|uniref:dynamin family protein n=1 Tax=unclassified Rhodococcus (in: high G+C Gram-positive bacteria) TaxID=192944 RepID=UPI001431905A|nr:MULTISPECIES: dynamin family protein [unclassified Rhodococcus (in: high G+C Gram-positive bacteria)]MBY6412206.1 dynamin family protein [Rhodococcus sp. BP-320]MBY6416786.1 dynamin family protein [Rhodococcus sp. BP-321]MBY6421676.1 dynamin family protein [Rhodococcus sp. BP-324]MBY6426942.1 dynamin family protein [Rhodococcus sp. BP-323]MBY6432108.1 dynamin family protein [Rhodococcus sp. BP-322]
MDGQAKQLADLLDRTAAVAQTVGRSDLVSRMELARDRVLDPRRRIVVVGPLKQGKSQFVNSLLNLEVCSVGDDETTAIPTIVQNAEQPSAQLVLADPGNDPIRVDLPLEELQTVTPASPRAEGREVLRLEVNVPSPLLADGLVLVDTPGVGGHGNPHAAATLGLIPSADAVLVVSDASREFTEPETAFLRQVLGLCPSVAVLITKTDLYPHWRQIVEANRGHLQREGLDVPMIPLSSLLRSHALRLNDEELGAESGFPDLYAFLRDQVVSTADATTRSAVSLDVRSVTEHLTLAMGSELAALRDPERAAAAVAGLQRAKAAAEELHKKTSQWQQTLSDGIADLASDIDHDLRDRLRRVTREAEETVDEGDPGSDWVELGEWLEEQIAASVGDNFVWAHERALWLSELVAEHFAAAGAVALPDLDLGDLENVLDPVASLADLETGKTGITQKVLVGMRGSYGGILMFGLITTFVGLSLLNPISIGAGVLLGTKAYKEDKENRIKSRRAEAKMAIRRFTDDVSFQVGKESKDRLRQIQRVLRDHFTSIAEQTLRSLNDSLKAAQEAANVETTERTTRIAQLDRDMKVVAELNERASALVPAGDSVR